MSVSFLRAMSRRSLDTSTTASQRRSIDRRTNLSHFDFIAHYHNQRPVVLAGLARDMGWPALACWSDAAYLSQRLEAEVLVLRSPDGRHFLKRDCEHFDGPFARVADMLFGPRSAPRRGERLYARTPLVGGLRDDVCLDALEELIGGALDQPGAAAAGKASRFKDGKCGVWLGSAGCVTPLHYDMCHGFLAGILGTKHFTYYSADDFRSLYPRPTQPELATALRLGLEDAAHLSCRIDASRRRQNAAKGRATRAQGHEAPRAEAVGVHGHGADEEAEDAEDAEAEALAWHATVLPGDVLYTPAYWWHHVETADDEAALSVLVPFDPTGDEPAPNSLFAS